MNKIRQIFSWFARQKLIAKLSIGCLGFLCLCSLVVVFFPTWLGIDTRDQNPGFDVVIEKGKVDITIRRTMYFKQRPYFRLENVTDYPDFQDLEFKFNPELSMWMVRHDQGRWKRFPQSKYIAGFLTVDLSQDDAIFINYRSGTWAFP
ncbi:MAG TPA: hypothetical protein PKL78_02195 [Anaerolineales bacterium]|nr:hypothetical protein [Anaerolineales bacterium]